MTRDELRILLIQEVKGLTSYLSNPTDYDNSMTTAELETWTLPVTTSFRIYWVKQRAKRHLFFMLASETAYEYKVKKFERQQKFDHFFKLIEKMDKDFLDAQTSNPEEFANVSNYNLFGTKIDAGFRYNGVGQDITYRSDNVTQFEPDEV